MLKKMWLLFQERRKDRKMQVKKEARIYELLQEPGVLETFLNEIIEMD